MKTPKFCLYFLFCIALMALTSCSDIIEPSISKSKIQPEAPVDQYTTSNYTINFWWDEVSNALKYHLQVVSPSFASPGALVADTVVSSYKIAINLAPGTYQWRVLAENGSSQTPYSSPRTFTISSSSITQQQVQLISPANTLLTNLGNISFQWGSLFGATSYQLEIDTNNFTNESSLVFNQTTTGQQINFLLPKAQTYKWRVRAFNDTAQAQWSVINSLTFDNIPPAQVGLSSPSDNLIVSLPVVLKWNAVSSAVNYRLYVFKGDSTTNYSSNFPMLMSTNDYNFNLGSSGDRIYWKVSALDAAGNEGAASSVRSFVLQ